MQDAARTKSILGWCPNLIKTRTERDPMDAHCWTSRPWNAGRVHPEIIHANFVSPRRPTVHNEAAVVTLRYFGEQVSVSVGVWAFHTRSYATESLLKTNMYSLAHISVDYERANIETTLPTSTT